MRKISTISTILLLLVAAAIAIGGCGGGDSSASGNDLTVTASSHSKAEFVKLANGICKRERQRLVNEVGAYIQEHKGEGKSEEELVDKAMETVVLPEVQKQIEEIRQLGAPKGDEKQIENLLVALQKAVDSAPHFSMVTDFDHASDLANAYDLEYCSYSK